MGADQGAEPVQCLPLGLAKGREVSGKGDLIFWSLRDQHYCFGQFLVGKSWSQVFCGLHGLGKVTKLLWTFFICSMGRIVALLLNPECRGEHHLVKLALHRAQAHLTVTEGLRGPVFSSVEWGLCWGVSDAPNL